MAVHVISSNQLTLEELSFILLGNVEIKLSDDSKQKIVRCREYLDAKLRNTNQTLYGINTGFGSLYNRHISSDQLEKLQDNLVKSHACGTGPELPEEIVRLMLYLKIQSVSYGYSGVQLSTVERLVDMFNNKVWPRVFEMGSLGASGDLAPLAHLTLPLLGLGEVNYENKIQTTETIHRLLGWKALNLRAKEGLALLNGTQFMSAYGIWVSHHANRLVELSSSSEHYH